jgi:hypothetical protein
MIPMSPREIVGYRIKQEPVRRGWSQVQLAQSVTDLIDSRWFPQTVGAAEKERGRSQLRLLAPCLSCE